MTEADEQTQSLQSLHEVLAGVPAGQAPDDCPEPACPKGADAVLARLVESFFWWEAGSKHAAAALEKLCAELVDYNELRICLPDETQTMIGVRFPRGQERCERLHATLNAIYNREHGLTLETLLSMPKREARMYLDGLEGITPFIASRVMLLTLGAHAFPVDSRVSGVLDLASLVDKGEHATAVSSKMERLLRAGECRGIYLGVEYLCDNPPKGGKPRSQTPPAKPEDEAAIPEDQAERPEATPDATPDSKPAEEPECGGPDAPRLNDTEPADATPDQPEGEGEGEPEANGSPEPDPTPPAQHKPDAG